MKTQMMIAVLGFFVALVACARNADPDSGSPAPKGKEGPSATWIKNLDSTRAVDCAGFRTVDNVFASGRIAEPVVSNGANDENVAELIVKAHADKTYQVYYREKLAPDDGRPLNAVDWRIITGTWTEQNGNVVLQGLGQLSSVGVPGHAEILSLALNHPIGQFGQKNPTFPLQADKVTNLDRHSSLIDGCTPGENPLLANSGGEVLVDGKAAAVFWLERLAYPVGALRRHSKNAFEHTDTEVNLWLETKGTFKLTYRVIDQPPYPDRKEIQGTWHVEEGLLVLDSWGVLVPEAAAGKTIPRLYLARDPETGVDIPYRDFSLEFMVN